MKNVLQKICFLTLLATLFGGGVAFAASPSALFTWEADDLTVTFDPSGSFDSDGDIEEYQWRYGGTGDPGTNSFVEKEVEHTYPDYGTYNVRLTVKDAGGNTDTYSQSIKLSEEAKSVNITDLTCTANNQLSATCLAMVSSDYEPSELTYEWDFGDGITREGNEGINHEFRVAGRYDVQVFVSGPGGEFDFDSYTLDLSDRDVNGPNADFSWTPQVPRVGESVHFQFTGIDTGGTVNLINWFIDGGFFRSGAQVSYEFEESGEHEVRVQALDNEGFEGEARRTVVVSGTGGESEAADSGGERSEIEPREYDVNTDYGQGGLVPCNGIDCEFSDFIELLNRVIEWIFYTAGVVATVMFAYAGWLYMSSGGSPQKISTAHNIFKKTAIGLIIIAVAWLIVNTITSTLLDTGNGFWTILQ